MSIREEWKNGNREVFEEIDEKDVDQQAMRNTINGAINQLTVIVDSATMTNAEVYAAVKLEAQVLRGILRYFKKEILR